MKWKQIYGFCCYDMPELGESYLFKFVNVEAGKSVTYKIICGKLIGIKERKYLVRNNQIDETFLEILTDITHDMVENLNVIVNIREYQKVYCMEINEMEEK